MFYQHAEMTTTEYVKLFTALVGAVKTFGGSYGREPGLLEDEIKIQAGIADRANPTAEELEVAYATCREEYLACMLLWGADIGRYYKLKDNLAINMALGQDNYPKTIVEMTQLLNDYRVPPRAQRVPENQVKCVAFVQEGKTLDVRKITCYHCGKKGHFNSLTAMVAYLQPLFNELCHCLITFQISNGFLLNLGSSHCYEACCINDVSRGPLLGYGSIYVC